MRDSRLVEIAEGLNAISDNAHAWGPEVIRAHAQSLRAEVDKAITEIKAVATAITPGQIYYSGELLGLLRHYGVDAPDVFMARREIKAALLLAAMLGDHRARRTYDEIRRTGHLSVPVR